MNAQLLSVMPITYDSLVVETTNRCTAKCAMCYQSAGPKGSNTLGRSVLPLDVMLRVVKEAREIPSLGRHLHFAGGEAFIAFSNCLSLVEAARSAGYAEISVTTNAFWAKRRVRAARVCRAIRESGLTRMEISWDAWHKPYVDPECIETCIRECRRYGIESILRVVTTRSQKGSSALADLSKAALSCLDEIYISPVVPIGRASRTIDPADVHRCGSLNTSCHQSLSLTVNAAGNVYPCCAGIDQTDTYIFGNVHEDSIARIAKRMNRSALLRTIVFGGVGSLVPVLESCGHEVPRQDFSSICHLCWWLFSNEDRAKAVSSYFQRAQSGERARILNELMHEV